jgi:hypothetical protein
MAPDSASAGADYPGIFVTSAGIRADDGWRVLASIGGGVEHAITAARLATSMTHAGLVPNLRKNT